MINNNNATRSIKNFGLNLYKIRTEKQVTRAKLAEMIGLSDQRIIYDYESDLKHPTLERVVLIANALNVTLDSLVI